MVYVQPEEAFRKHRHDVMNGLQLVKAYIQLGKPDAAEEAVNRMAEWFQALASIQNQLPEAETSILWTAAQCPRLRVKNLDSALLESDIFVSAICDAMTWWDEQVSLMGTKSMDLAFGKDESMGDCRLVMTVPDTKEIRDWWNHTGDNHPWKTWKHRYDVRFDSGPFQAATTSHPNRMSEE